MCIRDRLTNWEYIYDVSVFNDIKNDGVNMNEPNDISSSLVAAPFASMHSLPTGTGEDMKVAHLSPVAKKSKYVEDIIKCNTFGLEKILTLATSAEYLIPEEMSDLRVGYRCLLYTSPSPRDATLSRMPSSA